MLNFSDLVHLGGLLKVVPYLFLIELYLGFVWFGFGWF